jgi:hypothetical protein
MGRWDLSQRYPVPENQWTTGLSHASTNAWSSTGWCITFLRGDRLCRCRKQPGDTWENFFSSGFGMQVTRSSPDVRPHAAPADASRPALISCTVRWFSSDGKQNGHYVWHKDAVLGLRIRPVPGAPRPPPAWRLVANEAPPGPAPAISHRRTGQSDLMALAALEDAASSTSLHASLAPAGIRLRSSRLAIGPRWRRRGPRPG